MSDAVVNVMAMLTGNSTGMVNSFGMGAEAAKAFKDQYEKTNVAVGASSKEIQASLQKQAESAVAAANTSIAAIDKSRVASSQAAAEAQVAADRTVAAQEKAAAAAARASELQARAAQTGADADVQAAAKAVAAAEAAANAATLAAAKQATAYERAGASATAEAKAVEASAKAIETAEAAKAAAAEASATKISAAHFKVDAAAVKVGAGIAAGAAVIGVASLEMAAKFEKSTELLVTAGGESQDALEGVKTGILEIAKSTGVSAEQLAEGMYIIEKSGHRGADGLTMLKSAAQAAVAEGVDMSTMMTALTSVMTTYGIKSEDSVSITNAMVVAAGASKTTMQEFAGSLSTVLPIAQTAGLSFDQIGGAISTMTQHGTSAAEATQELRNAVQNLLAPNQVATNEMSQLGINAQDVSSQLGTRGLTGTLEYLREKVLSSSDGGRVLLGTMKESELAGKAMGTMLASMPEGLKKMSQGLLDGTVTAKEYNKYIHGLDIDGSATGQQFEVLAKKMNGFSDALKSGNPASQTYVQAMEKMMGGTTGLQTMLMLTGDNMPQFAARTEEIGAAMKTSGDDIETNAATQATLAAQTARTKEKMEALGISIGDNLTPQVEGALDGMKNFSEFSQQNSKDVNRFWYDLGGSIHNFADDAGKNLGKTVDDFKGWNAGAASNIKDFGTNTAGMVTDFDNNTRGMFSDFFKNTKSGVDGWNRDTTGMFEDFNKNTQGMFSDFFTKVGGKWETFWKDPIGNVNKFTKDMRESLQKWDGETSGMFNDFFKNTSDGFRGWREDNGRETDKFFKAMPKNVEDFNKTTNGMFNDFFKNTADGFKGWREDNTKQTEGFNKDSGGNIEDFNKSSNGMFDDFFRNTTQGFKGWREDNGKATEGFKTDAAKNVGDFNTSTNGMFTDWASNTGGMLTDWGSNSRSMFNDWKNNTTGETRTFAEDSIRNVDKFNKDTNGMFEDWKNNTIGMVRDFGNTAGGNIETFKNNTVGMFTDFTNNTRGMFDDMFRGIGDGFNGLREAAAGPVRFVVNTVYNDGIRKAWNSVNDGLNLGLSLPEAHFATGGIMPGYSPGVDNHVIAVGGGEAIMRPEWTKAVGAEKIHAMNAMARGGNTGGIQSMLGFADGGIVGDVMANIGSFIGNPLGGLTDMLKPFTGMLGQTGGGNWGQMMGAFPGHVMSSLGDKIGGLFAAHTAAVGGGGSPISAGDAGAGVQQWAGLVSQALTMVGQPQDLLGSTLRRMNQESGGNVNAINDWDSNAMAGIPSKGLMQVIDPTFRANAMPGYDQNIYDPLSNILASMRYAISAYGSLGAAYDRSGGYSTGGIVPVFDQGGWVPPGRSVIENRTGSPEHLSNTTSGGHGGLEGSTIILEIPELGGRLEAKIKDVMAQGHATITRSLRGSAGVRQGGF